MVYAESLGAICMLIVVWWVRSWEFSWLLLHLNMYTIRNSFGPLHGVPDGMRRPYNQIVLACCSDVVELPKKGPLRARWAAEAKRHTATYAFSLPLLCHRHSHDGSSRHVW
jgi:hypothetical protein